MGLCFPPLFHGRRDRLLRIHDRMVRGMDGEAMAKPLMMDVGLIPMDEKLIRLISPSCTWRRALL